MDSTPSLLNTHAPKELCKFVRNCTDTEDLVTKLFQNQAHLLSFVENMNIEGNEPLALRLLVKIHLENLDKVKNVETVLRNKGLLNREAKDTDLSIKDEESKPNVLRAHKAILALESPYFKAMKEFEEFRTNELVMREMGIPPEVYQNVLDYLYLSDEKRSQFLATVNKAHLFPMAELADRWGIHALKSACDEELCNALDELSIEKEQLEYWLAQDAFVPKFVRLLKFLVKINGEHVEALIERMQTPKGAARLAAECNPQEIALFSTLKTEFGKACQIPPGTFGVAEWEKAFPVKILEVPPLPAGIHAILEMEDPCEPGKKLKDTCILFLRPQSVMLHDQKGGSKELMLSFDGVEELAKNATEPSRRTEYITFDRVRQQLNDMPIAKSGWVLMRKEVINDTTETEAFVYQKIKLKDKFEAPKAMDMILLNILTHAKDGKYLYGQDPIRIYSNCQEVDRLTRQQIAIGGFGSTGLCVADNMFIGDKTGLSASWKF